MRVPALWGLKVSLVGSVGLQWVFRTEGWGLDQGFHVDEGFLEPRLMGT